MSHALPDRGVGLVAVNALSERLEVATTRDQATSTQRYIRGVPTHGVELIATQRAGATITNTARVEASWTVDGHHLRLAPSTHHS
ncbi:hypothetical protein BH11MYX1_BH11MYX1_08440 [soil metagenome]